MRDGETEPEMKVMVGSAKRKDLQTQLAGLVCFRCCYNSSYHHSDIFYYGIQAVLTLKVV